MEIHIPNNSQLLPMTSSSTTRRQAVPESSSPLSALLPVCDDIARFISRNKFQLLCTFGQVDLQLATMGQTLMEIMDSIGLCDKGRRRKKMRQNV